MLCTISLEVCKNGSVCHDFAAAVRLGGAIGGMADTFMAKGKAKTFDAKLAKATKWIGAVFIVLTLVLNILH